MSENKHFYLNILGYITGKVKKRQDWPTSLQVPHWPSRQASSSRFFIEISVEQRYPCVGRASLNHFFCLKTPQSDPPWGSDLKGSSNGLVFLEWLKGQLCVCCNSFHLTLIQSIQPLSKEDNATATFIIQCQIRDPACSACVCVLGSNVCPKFFFFKDSRFSAKIVLFGELISAKATLYCSFQCTKV